MHPVVLHRTSSRDSWRVHGTGLCVCRSLDGNGFHLQPLDPFTKAWIDEYHLDLNARFRTLREVRRTLNALFVVAPPSTNGPPPAALIRVSAGHYRTPDNRWQILQQTTDTLTPLPTPRWVIIRHDDRGGHEARGYAPTLADAAVTIGAWERQTITAT